MSKKVFKLINKLDHPNIIKVNYFYEDGYFYVIRTYDDDYVITFFANKKGSWNFTIELYRNILVQNMLGEHGFLNY